MSPGRLAPLAATRQVATAMLMLAIAAGTAMSQLAGPARAAPAAAIKSPARALTGTFFAESIDALPLPMTDRVTDRDGTTYLVEFDRLVLSLRANQRFRASVRFRRTVQSRDLRGRLRTVPIQSMTVNGSYAIVAGEIRFTPDPSSETSGVQMLTGRVDGPRRLTMPFDYRNGITERRRVLTLVLQDNVY